MNMEWQSVFILFLLLGFEQILEANGGSGRRTGVITTQVIPRRYLSHYRPTWIGNGKKYHSKKNRFQKRKLVVTKNKETCDGEENFKTDIGLVSFFLGAISSAVGIFTVVVNLPEMLGKIVDIINEGIGALTVVLDAITIFPENFNEAKWTAQRVVGRELVENFLNRYGCYRGRALLT